MRTSFVCSAGNERGSDINIRLFRYEHFCGTVRHMTRIMPETNLIQIL
jgi:hypothetical protein